MQKLALNNNSRVNNNGYWGVDFQGEAVKAREGRWAAKNPYKRISTDTGHTARWGMGHVGLLAVYVQSMWLDIGYMLYLARQKKAKEENKELVEKFFVLEEGTSKKDGVAKKETFLRENGVAVPTMAEWRILLEYFPLKDGGKPVSEGGEGINCDLMFQLLAAKAAFENNKKLVKKGDQKILNPVIAAVKPLLEFLAGKADSDVVKKLMREKSPEEIPAEEAAHQYE